MILKFIILICLSINYMLLASDFSKEEERLIFSMDLLELIEIEIGTGTPISQKYAPAVTSIITSEEMRQNASRTLHEALENIPGLHVYLSNLAVLSEFVSIRGIQTEHNPQVLILMDGTPLNDLLDGNPGLLFKMPVSIIHRIEIIRGPGSALYGADAFAGVINIISKNYLNIKDEAGVRYGSFNTWETWINKKFDIKDVSIGLALSIMSSDGDDARIIQKDAFNSPLSLAPGALSTNYDVAYLHADAHYKDFIFNILVENSENLGLGAGHLRILDDVGQVERTKILFNAQHTNSSWFENTKIKTKLSHTYTDAKPNFVPYPRGTTRPPRPGAEPFTFVNGTQGNPHEKEYIYSSSINAIHSGIKNHAINSEIGYKYSKIKPSQSKNFGKGVVPSVLTDITNNEDAVYMKEQSRTNYYAFIQDQYKINSSLDFTTGVRYDNYDDFGSTINPRFALVWQHSSELTIKAMYGRAFRAPSFSELYFQNSPAIKGNKELNPEIIDTYEIAFNYRAPIHTKLNVFYYRAKDLIDFVPVAGVMANVAQNIKDQNGYGLEVELEYVISENLIARANYAYQHSEDAKTKDRVADAPVHQGFAQLQYRHNKNWNINTQYNYIGKRYRIDTDTREPLDSDSLVNLTIERKNILQGVDFLVSARNLFDSDYKEPSNGQINEDYPMQGRYIFAEIRYSF